MWASVSPSVEERPRPDSQVPLCAELAVSPGKRPPRESSRTSHCMVLCTSAMPVPVAVYTGPGLGVQAPSLQLIKCSSGAERRAEVRLPGSTPSGLPVGFPGLAVKHSSPRKRGLPSFHPVRAAPGHQGQTGREGQADEHSGGSCAL